MKRNWKRTAALCLAAAMLFGLNSLPVLAQTATPESAASPETAQQEEAPAEPETPSVFRMPRMFALFSMPGETKTTGDLQVSGGEAGTDYTYENGVLTLKSGSLTVAMQVGPAPSTDRIVVASGYKGTLTLNNVNLDQSQAGGCAMALETGADVTLNLTGINTLQSGGSYAGLYVPEGAALTVTGEGDLTVQGGDPGNGGGAGIGGSQNALSFGTITLRGTGTITATGGNRAAGIGSGGRLGGDRVVSGTICIESGTIMATSGQNAAAIGCGPDVADNRISIRISGGQVSAIDGLQGAGIGAGWSTNGVGTIEITGGTVYAKGNGGAGIGKPGGTETGKLIISGGMVEATDKYGDDINCPMSTGSDGHAVIYANTITHSSSGDWNCLLISDSSATWYGDNDIICDSELLLDGSDLTIPEGRTLTVYIIGAGHNSTLQVDGTLDAQIMVTQEATLTVAESGTVQVAQEFLLDDSCCTNSGSLLLYGTSQISMETGGSFTNTGIVEVVGQTVSVEGAAGSFSNDGVLVSTHGGQFSLANLNYEHRIFFDGNGGSCDTENLITTNKSLPDLPDATRDGYILDGWYTAAEGGTKITPDYVFTDRTTVYAHWKEKPAEPPAPENPPVPEEPPVSEPTPAPAAGSGQVSTASQPAAEEASPAEHTLRFATNGGLPLEAVTIGRGAIVELWPYNPTRTGYLFAGWYADEALTQPVSSVLMNADKTVYAAWTTDPAAAARSTAAQGTAGKTGTGNKTGSTGNAGSQVTASPDTTPEPTQTPQPTVSPAPTQTPAATAGPTATPAQTASAPAEQSGLPLWPFLLGGVVIVAILVVVLLRRRN